ncbi:transposase [Xanthomonas arboricola]|uniref:transposase n=1 Tax=Xanthomonas arboricola TaxID=56448 RepID=UPI0021A90C59|nr:transposase [Xanthomonas arboricola]
MARLPRIDLPGIPQHIVQCGNNRLPCFLDDGDRLRYLQLTHEAMHATGCQLHAFVLMDNHVHLLVTPPDARRIGQRPLSDILARACTSGSLNHLRPLCPSERCRLISEPDPITVLDLASG